MRRQQETQDSLDAPSVDATLPMSEPGHDPALQWLADASNSETTRRRSLEHSLLRQIREAATLAGSLAELAKRSSGRRCV